MKPWRCTFPPVILKIKNKNKQRLASLLVAWYLYIHMMNTYWIPDGPCPVPGSVMDWASCNCTRRKHEDAGARWGKRSLLLFTHPNREGRPWSHRPKWPWTCSSGEKMGRMSWRKKTLKGCCKDALSPSSLSLFPPRPFPPKYPTHPTPDSTL